MRIIDTIFFVIFTFSIGIRATKEILDSPDVSKTYFISYLGCFSVWSATRTEKLEPPPSGSFDPSHMRDMAICATKCLNKYVNTETTLAFIRGNECLCSPQNLPSYLGTKKELNACGIKCSNGGRFYANDVTYFCGGNTGYSVYYIQSSNTSTNVSGMQDLSEPTNIEQTNKKHVPCPLTSTTCLKVSKKRYDFDKLILSPLFDYFPLNSVENCIDFCFEDVIYFDWREQKQSRRTSTDKAYLVWWKTADNQTLPVCACLQIGKKDIVTVSADCTYTCPVHKPSYHCGGYDDEFLIASGYSPVRNPLGCGSRETCRKQCIQRDRHGYLWYATCNETASTLCHNLIADSIGTAYWKCTIHGVFETPSPNVSNCRSTWIEKMEEMISQVNSTSMASELGLQLFKACNDPLLNVDSTRKYFGHEMRNLSSLGSELVGITGENLYPSHHEFENLVNVAVELNACLIKTHEPWIDLSLVQKTGLASHILNVTEDVLFYLTFFVKQPSYKKVLTPLDQFIVVAETFAKNNSSRIPNEFPTISNCFQGTSITMPYGWADQFNGTKVETVSMSMSPTKLAVILNDKRVHQMKGNEKIINGQMISLSMASSTEGETFSHLRLTLKTDRSKHLKLSEKGAHITFPHIRDAVGEHAYEFHRKLYKKEEAKVAKGGQCVFWDTNSFMWSTEGCKHVSSTRTATICECSHLTAFAVLMDVHRYVGKEPGLEILTLTLCPLSTLALLATLVMLSLFKSGICNIRATIRKHTSFCLSIGNAMFLIVLDKHYFYRSEKVCKGLAMMVHYTYLCAFTWMLLEGVQMYRRVVLVFDSGKSYKKLYWFLGYGVPVLPLAMSGIIAHVNGDELYGGEEYCWLVGSYTWGFMGPVAMAILINIIILIISLKTAYQLQQQKLCNNLTTGKVLKRLGLFRLYFKGLLSLTINLGITWGVGYFLVLEGPSKIVTSYAFTILNASQGMLIFVFACQSCIMNFKWFPCIHNISNQQKPM